MEEDPIAGGIIFFFIAMILIATGIYVYLNFIASRRQPFKLIDTHLPLRFKEPLQKYFLYYQFLNSEQKTEFERRLNNFIHNKHFIPMHGMVITNEVKALIAASAIQLTLGLPEVYFVHFDKIMIFPDKFFNKTTQSLHKGEVGQAGHIAFSWNDFAEGYIKHDNAYNVGLHEMAHALSLENKIKNQEYHFLDAKKLHNWKILADKEYEAIKSGAPSFLRKYATSDRSEFFPVCIEHFFERPAEFKKESPELYKVLSDLLNQDLLEGKNSVAPKS